MSYGLSYLDGRGDIALIYLEASKAANRLGLYVFTEDAFTAVTAAGGKFRRIFAKNMLNYAGYEYFIPPRAFPIFNASWLPAI